MSAGARGAEGHAVGALSPLHRAAGVAGAWVLLYLAGPGIATPDGLALLAPLALALWAAFASRPGRGAFWIELLLGGVAWSAICSWSAWVHWSSLAFIGPGMGLYAALSGVVLRRLPDRLPLALRAPVAWVAIEALRTLLEPPFGLPWMRLGVHAHDVAWLAGSARIFGVWGLSFAIAAVGGALADLALSWRDAGDAARRRRRWATLLGGGAPLAAAALAAWSQPPTADPGPRVLLVQPAFPQARKMESRKTGAQLFVESRDLTLRGLDEARAEGERLPDLVAWGETMLPAYVLHPGLAAAVAAGATPAPWFDFGRPFDDELIALLERYEDNWVRDALLASGSGGVLPPGCAFVSGVEVLLPDGERVGRQNAVAVWSDAGERSPQVGKAHRVPGAETMLGLERYAWVRDIIYKVAGYVPDLVAHQGSRRLSFRDRAGREYQFSVAVCFDNAFDGPFLAPMEEGPVDFHLVCSNEAWFGESQEADQMMAFSRLEAIATARSIVRSTNSGISAVIGPTGLDVGRLVVDGRDREVAGVLRSDIPVPTAAMREQRTFYARTWRIWPLLALAGPGVLALLARRRPASVTPSDGTVR